ncbi:hypothetical protein V8C35DRAFT_325418 [Trichoderma chlorosporum]
MNIAKILTSLIWRTPKTQPQTSSYILQLPVELLLEIFNFLPPYSQLLVYQTCRPLRIIIYQFFIAGKGGEIPSLPTLEYKLLYLTHLARSLPNRWVCATCCKLHQTYYKDTPSARTFYIPKCGDGKHWASQEPSESRSFENQEYSPSHRHIELTLKYTRLKSHQQHLQRLLTAHHATSKRSSICVAKGILAQRSFYPKVVNGRYLLFTVRTYLSAKTILRQSIQFIQICPHLNAWSQSPVQSYRMNRLETTLHMVFSALPDTPKISSSCLSCGTDFSIQLSLKRILICVWQDLGPEGTIYDPDWGAISGSIRELYGQQEHNGEVL